MPHDSTTPRKRLRGYVDDYSNEDNIAEAAIAAPVIDCLKNPFLRHGSPFYTVEIWDYFLFSRIGLWRDLGRFSFNGNEAFMFHVDTVGHREQYPTLNILIRCFERTDLEGS